MLTGVRVATTTRTTSSILPTAATDINGGGGGGAPSPGSGHDIFGPDDDYIASAPAVVVPLLATLAGGLVAGAGLLIA